MGSGKTTIGKQVAAQLGLQFHDCDDEIEKSTGASVNLIFDVEGENGFRKRESALLKKLASNKGVLIATGGGVVINEANRKILRANGLVVWLRATVEQQLKRLSHDKKRPLMQTPDRRSNLERLAQERNPLYEAVSDIQYYSPNRNSRYAARELSSLILNHLDSSDEGILNHGGH